MTNLLVSINQMKQHGDAVRIARIVNAERAKNGKKNISPQYISMMLCGTRKMTNEVKEVAEIYFEKQQELQTI